ncbi:hypothetical protein JCM18549_02310 [Halolamina salina]
MFDGVGARSCGSFVSNYDSISFVGYWDSTRDSTSFVDYLRPQCAEHEARHSTDSPPLPRGPATAAGPRRPPPPHRRGCRREADAALCRVSARGTNERSE